VTPTPAFTAPSSRRRADAVDVVAEQLAPRASLITRLLLRKGTAGISRADSGILSALDHGPQRVTELAQGQALAQPTVTQLVAGLEDRDLVARGRHPDDGRVVLVTITDGGRAALAGLRDEYRAVLREHLAGRTDDEVLALAAATDLLQEVIDALHGARA
jgi:DNA-binding MarR family transcriptional regulator